MVPLTDYSNGKVSLTKNSNYFKKIKKRPQKPGKNKKQLLAELRKLRNKKR